MSTGKTLHWFRQDLRLADNPALHAAAAEGQVLPVYVLDDESAGDHAMGAASRVWLHHSLQRLDAALAGRLVLLRGRAEELLPPLVKRLGLDAVTWNRCYEPWRIDRDARLKDALRAQGTRVTSHNGALLWEPWQVAKGDGSPYRVFTPFYRRGCLSAPTPRKPLPVPALSLLAADGEGLALEGLSLLPRIRWDSAMMHGWTPGENGAHARLDTFLEENLFDYEAGRNYPARPNVSRLSPSLHLGEISPNTVWHGALEQNGGELPDKGGNLDRFLTELGWREFSNSLLYHNPELPRTPLQARFAAFPWQTDALTLARWQRGMTGYPIVDAGMRELWQTGYMHNRVRMIVGSFLVKNLLIHWHEGERWFWDCLVDADLASNSASWQWIAGCGADAAPYFRIFNPITQGEKFDPAGEYTRRFVPELAALPDKYLFKPFDAPALTLQAAGVKLGETYPTPVVEVRASRQRALDAFASIRSPA